MAKRQEIDELRIELQDLEIEEIVPVELNEEGQGHPENLASTFYCCTDATVPVLK